VATVTIGATGLSDGATRWLAVLGPLLRAVVLTPATNRSPHASGRALANVQCTGDALNQLDVPIVCSSDCELNGRGLLTCCATDYLINCHAVLNDQSTSAKAEVRGARVSCDPLSRALQLVAWLSNHPPSGAAHMLALSRSSGQGSEPSLLCDKLKPVKLGVLHSACAHVEAQLQLRRWIVDAYATSPPCPSLLRLRSRTHNAPVKSVAQASTCNERTLQGAAVSVHALELYLPRHCTSTEHLGTGMQACSPPAERCHACGEDEDAVSMALTAMHRLMRRCAMQTCEVGTLHVRVAPLDRSKSMKSELMMGLETGECAEAEGVDHYGVSSGSESPLLGCISWAGSPSWDGR
jgi:hypothetical protein